MIACGFIKRAWCYLSLILLSPSLNCPSLLFPGLSSLPIILFPAS